MSGRPWWNREPCGTPAAYARHLRKGERTCRACRRAHTGAATPRMRAWRARKAAEAGQDGGQRAA